MSDERRRARERLAAQGDPGAVAALAVEGCRVGGHAFGQQFLRETREMLRDGEHFRREVWRECDRCGERAVTVDEHTHNHALAAPDTTIRAGAPPGNLDPVTIEFRLWPDFGP